MTNEEFRRAKRANDRCAMLLVVAFIAWLPVYLIFVMPTVREVVLRHIDAYPAILHLVPIFGPIVLLGLALAKFFPAPKRPTSADADQAPRTSD